MGKRGKGYRWGKERRVKGGVRERDKGVEKGARVKGEKRGKC